MHLALLGILQKIDKQLALLRFGMFVIRRGEICLFLKDSALFFLFFQIMTITVCNKSVLIHMMVVH